MYLEAEKLLRELITCSKDGAAYCKDVRSVAFSELKECDMLADVRPYASGGAYIKLSTKALHYFKEKEAEEKRAKEKELEERRAQRRSAMRDICLVVLGAALTFLFQLLASFLKLD
ncbi:hypothetical protein [Atopobium minutum]|uniref:hypothetical protein n=1 Tax=Atopobium minutum TaxID=1381 RepID=UPI0025E7A9FD|nr:hypothetical protein [Atopobium minutum]